MTLAGPFDILSVAARKALRTRRPPRWTTPMLATLTSEPFSDDGWIYERKLDGVRCLAFRNGRSTRLLSRNRKEQNGTYPELVEAIQSQACDDFVVDGEIVAFERGKTSFARLQGRMKLRDPDEARRSRIAVYFYLFDVLHLEGRDTTRLALRDRKALLRKALHFEDPLRFTVHRKRNGEKLLRDACRKGWEGLIAKRADAPYVHARSTDWRKLKCVNQQEVVVGGFTEPRGSRIGLGALLVGYHENGDLRYAGKVGTGYDDETLRSLRRRLASIERDSSPFSDETRPRKGVRWVRPRLVAEVGFTEWTADGRLRHPRFLGLRSDKSPKEVVRERPGS